MSTTRADYPPAHAQWVATMTVSEITASEVRVSRVISIITSWTAQDVPGEASPLVAASVVALDETGLYWPVGGFQFPGTGTHRLVRAVALGATCEEATLAVRALAASWAPGAVLPLPQ